jgi:hypothetical protein
MQRISLTIYTRSRPGSHSHARSAAFTSQSCLQAIGHPTSNSTIYNLLNRHGWRKGLSSPNIRKQGGSVQERIGTFIRAYEEQGFHRTGTTVDQLSGDWLVDEVRQIGLEPMARAISKELRLLASDLQHGRTKRT